MTEKTTKQEVSDRRETSECSALLTGVIGVIKEMRQQIDYSRSLGDNSEAEFLEQYCKELELLTQKDS